MADAWSTVVEREPEYDDYTRSQIFALMAWESRECPNCHRFDSLVPIPSNRGEVVWTEHGGRVVEVLQYRCLTCGAAEAARRSWRKYREDEPEPELGHTGDEDGLVFIPRFPDET